MGTLRMAVRQRRWEAAALYLLVAVMEAAGQVPQDALPGLLEALAPTLDGGLAPGSDRGLEGERSGEG
ncbi:MAG: hypothetical protein Q8O40_12430 [Chloroflexota bacterium]|nr:hypothetical protein [Chloroflexota bacterium]